MLRTILSVFVLPRPDMDRPAAPRFENCCRYKSGRFAPNLADIRGMMWNKVEIENSHIGQRHHKTIYW